MIENLPDNNSQKKQVNNIINSGASFLFMLYIWSMPFTSAFAITSTILLPVVFGGFLFVYMLVLIFLFFKLPYKIATDDCLIMLFLTLVLASFLFGGYGNKKSLNHTISFFAPIILFYTTVKYFLLQRLYSEKFERSLLRVFTIVTIFNALFGCAEFVLYNFFSFRIDDYIPRVDVVFYEASVNEMFQRARGFAPESGHYTFMLELFFPLAIYYMFFSGYCMWPKWIKYISVFSFVCGFVFAVSVASFGIIPIAFGISSIFYFGKMLTFIKKNLTAVILTLLGVVFLIYIISLFFPLYNIIILSFSDKLNSGSYDDRQDRMEFFYTYFPLQTFEKQLIGIGPAAFAVLGFDDSKSILSFYYLLIFELGVLGLLCFLVFQLYLFIKILTTKGALGFCLLFSFLAGSMHYYFINNYWYPWYWFVCALIIFYSRKRKGLNYG